MKRVVAICALAAIAFVFGCQQQPQPPSGQEWFSGTFEEALAEAQSRGALLMLDFYAET